MTPNYIAEMIRVAVEDATKALREENERLKAEVRRVSDQTITIIDRAKRAEDALEYEIAASSAQFKRAEKLSNEIRRVMPMVCQLLDGWHQDGTVWTSHDTEVRRQAGDLLALAESDNGILPKSESANRALVEALKRLKAKAAEFAKVDRRVADSGGGIAFSADHLRGSAAAYEDMTKHIEAALAAHEERSKDEGEK